MLVSLEWVCWSMAKAGVFLPADVVPSLPCPLSPICGSMGGGANLIQSALCVERQHFLFPSKLSIISLVFSEKIIAVFPHIWYELSAFAAVHWSQNRVIYIGSVARSVFELLLHTLYSSGFLVLYHHRLLVDVKRSLLTPKFFKKVYTNPQVFSRKGSRPKKQRPSVLKKKSLHKSVIVLIFWDVSQTPSLGTHAPQFGNPCFTGS